MGANAVIRAAPGPYPARGATWRARFVAIARQVEAGKLGLARPAGGTPLYKGARPRLGGRPA